MREVLASLVRVLDDPMVLVTVGEALGALMLARTRRPPGAPH